MRFDSHRLKKFKDKVKSNGDWDLKTKPEWHITPGTVVNGRTLEDWERFTIPFMYIDGDLYSGADIGNINYGYAGLSAGFAVNILFMFAGAYQVISKTSNLEWLGTFF